MKYIELLAVKVDRADLLGNIVGRASSRGSCRSAASATSGPRAGAMTPQTIDAYKTRS